MQQQNFEICNNLGLHVRASSKFVDEACKFVSEMKIVTKESEADLKRIFQVMSLGLKYKDKFELVIDGADEVEAMQAMRLLIESGFGENT